MNRRGFLKGLVGTGIIAAAPTIIILGKKILWGAEAMTEPLYVPPELVKLTPNDGRNISRLLELPQHHVFADSAQMHAATEIQAGDICTVTDTRTSTSWAQYVIVGDTWMLVNRAPLMT